jgi:hypothetical protein
MNIASLIYVKKGSSKPAEISTIYSIKENVSLGISKLGGQKRAAFSCS